MSLSSPPLALGDAESGMRKIDGLEEEMRKLRSRDFSAGSIPSAEEVPPSQAHVYKCKLCRSAKAEVPWARPDGLGCRHCNTFCVYTFHETKEQSKISKIERGYLIAG